MKTKNKIKVYFAAIVAILTSFSSVNAQSTGSGGGDTVRKYFILNGGKALDSQIANTQFTSCIAKWGVTVSDLKAQLTIDVVKGVQGPLYDEQGSIVDASSVKGSIHLDSDKWLEQIINRVDLTQLMIHETIKAATDKDKDKDYECSKYTSENYQATANDYQTFYNLNDFNGVWEGRKDDLCTLTLNRIGTSDQFHVVQTVSSGCIALNQKEFIVTLEYSFPNLYQLNTSADLGPCSLAIILPSEFKPGKRWYSIFLTCTNGYQADQWKVRKNY